MINVNWNRWILASAFTHFTDRVGENLVLDGMDRDGLDKDPLFAEFRLDGPRILQLNKNYYRLWFAVNIVVTAAIDPVDLTKKHDLIGDIDARTYGLGGTFFLNPQFGISPFVEYQDRSKNSEFVQFGIELKWRS